MAATPKHEDAALPLKLNGSDAVQMNQDLMRSFHEALEKDPAADLLSILATSISGPSTAFYDAVARDPEIDLLEHFPSDYARGYKWALPTPKKTNQTHELQQLEQQPPTPPDWLREKLDPFNTASVVYPLSMKALALLQEGHEMNVNLCEISLATSLKSLILKSERLFELSIRGVVVKCSDEIVIKVFSESRDLTEYHNLQYLANRAPHLPIPRTHGLIQLGKFRAMFMSYIPGVTLDKVWPCLSHGAKVSIQKQLDRIFSQLRDLRQVDRAQLGGVSEERVKNYQIMESFAYKGITTARQFDELQFSAKHRASPSYVKLLRCFLEDQNKTLQGSVYTHGDLKKCNIMVRKDSNTDAYTVTGIIDWEDSGFYPEYYESTTLSNPQGIDTDDDWYLYVPDCISPVRFPVRWLVDRLWGSLLWSWRTDIVQ
ncbi:hypothetical protein GX51_04466 [Blastomyces parvus]|uniref:Aminoglycoside phosphotransferase domain-containing protein n=1 Tax=Blastomyces parvus TaxID=2060905 RepID=A0A2B7X1V7_9EURO|nr:hypothetical protein GX51_04466 [Blastomyces parvus]